MPSERRWWCIFASLSASVAVAGAWLDAKYGWITPAFDGIAHQFYEIPQLGRIRRISQLELVRMHLAIGSALVVGALVASAFLSRHARIWLAIFALGYALRAVVWIAGGNLPLVPGDSCHYLEVATSVQRGQGPVKHYVESFFTDYAPIREGRGVLDDWATPLDAYVRAFVFSSVGIDPAGAPETRLAAAKAVSFVVNLLALPAIYGFARRRYGPAIGLWSMAVLAILPVHVIYAGFILRESLVALLSILAIWMLTELFAAEPRGRAIWLWAVTAGLCAGLAILARTTNLAILGAGGLFAMFYHGRARFGPLLLAGAIGAVVITPWAWATLREYGSPFHSYTSFFEYNFSWAIHHYEKGNTLPAQFYTPANLPEIVRVKIKSVLIIAVYSTMIVGLPLVLGFTRRLRLAESSGGETDWLVAFIVLVVVLATLKSIADVTQVAQLGRYYLPVFALMIPSAVTGLADWGKSLRIDRRALPWLCAGFAALVWADPTWAYDASWLVKPFQLHWPALHQAGEWVQSHPDTVPRDARIMTWFPWELRATSDRITILLPRNYDARRIDEVIRQYGVTHLLWGSFEPPPDVDPELWGPYLEQVKARLNLTNDRELFRSSREEPYPVRLYRLR
jgi:4-amino-4-deoxy-L-arabinose transferase-like glycosyltransferase